MVNLPRENKLVPARFQELRAAEVPTRNENGVTIRVFSGQAGDLVAPTQNYAPVTMLEATLEAGASVELDIAADFNAFVVVLGGSGAVGLSAAPVRGGQVAWLTLNREASTIRLAATDEKLRALFFAGQPLREPVAARSPFVMNTQEELAAGFAEFRAQQERFGL